MERFCGWIEQNCLCLSRNNHTGISEWLTMTPDELCRWTTADILLNRENTSKRKK